MRNAQPTWHLRNVNFFAGLNPEETDLMYAIFKRASFDRGEILYFPEEPAERLFFLQTGLVKLCLVTPEGDEKVIDIFQAGDVFGEMFLSQSRRYAYQATALEDVIVATLTQEGFKSLMKTFPNLCLQLVRHLVEHHRRTMAMLETLIRTDAPHRLLRVLVSLGERQGHADDAQFNLHPSLTQEDLGNMTGLNRSTVSILVNEFRRQGILSGHGRQIIVNRDLADVYLSETELASIE